MKILFKLAVSILTFVIGISVNAIWQANRYKNSQEEKSSPIPAANETRATLLVTEHCDSTEQPEYVERLTSPAKAKGFIGGESHDSYVIMAREGQTMTVQITWKREHFNGIGNNVASFWVGDLPNYDGEGEVEFGKESHRETRWSGRIPKTGDYYVYVNAYPTAEYTLFVTVK
jgi:hypothetical protein